jgi:hypothetical protein
VSGSAVCRSALLVSLAAPVTAESNGPAILRHVGPPAGSSSARTQPRSSASAVGSSPPTDRLLQARAVGGLHGPVFSSDYDAEFLRCAARCIQVSATLWGFQKIMGGSSATHNQRN